MLAGEKTSPVLLSATLANTFRPVTRGLAPRLELHVFSRLV